MSDIVDRVYREWSDANCEWMKKNGPTANGDDIRASLSTIFREVVGPYLMQIPFERSKAIRKGELDQQMPDYEEITGWFQRVPKTWIPGILADCVHAAVIQEVFRDGALTEFVSRAEERAKDPTSILRRKA